MDILTLIEAAAYLKVKPGTLREWAAEDKVPAYKMGSHWRFNREKLDKWLDLQRNGA